MYCFIHISEFGSACQLGVTLEIPCIGVAKKLFHVDGLEKNAEHAQKIVSYFALSKHEKKGSKF